MLAQMIRMSQNKSRVAQAAILAMEIVLLPTGLISTLLILKDSTNPFCFLHSLFCNLRDHCLRFKLSLLSSPFVICLFINSIVILILLSSSKFHHRRIEPYDLFSYDAGDIPALPPSPAGTVPFENGTENFTKQSETTMATNKTGPIFLEDDQDIISGSVDVKEHHQNCEIAINEEEEEDTIEATWEAIGGRGAEEKQNSKLKKSDTWPRPPLPPPQPTGQDTIMRPAAAAGSSWKELRKSVTFNDAVSACRRGGLARDVLRSPEEMNKRFDDFIQKVNHELRLQRQESDQRFLETINRGR